MERKKRMSALACERAEGTSRASPLFPIRPETAWWMSPSNPGGKGGASKEKAGELSAKRVLNAENLRKAGPAEVIDEFFPSLPRSIDCFSLSLSSSRPSRARSLSLLSSLSLQISKCTYLENEPMSPPPPASPCLVVWREFEKEKEEDTR